MSIENNLALALADGLTVEANPSANSRPDSGKAFESGPGIDPTSAAGSDARLRLEQAARRDFQFIWRCIRRFGIQSNHAVDHAVQRVFEVAAARASIIEAGHERAFLFKTAVLVTKELRRKQARSREVFDTERVECAMDEQDDPEQLLEARQWRSVLDQLLEALPLDLRTAFVLYELEGQKLDQIAELLDIPQGTVASRLRRARAAFHEKARKLKAAYAETQVRL